MTRDAWRARVRAALRVHPGGWLSGLGAAALVLVFLNANVLGSRFFKRWDVTSQGLYSLSSVTLSTLNELKRPVEVVVFLSRTDPLTSSVSYLLDAYRAQTRELSVRFIDPDREPAAFIAAQRQYGIFEGKTEDGRLATEASVVIASGEKRWFVTVDDLVSFDEEQAQARPRLEAALTEGIVNVLGRERVRVCFTQGHQELSVSAGGPQGLSEFRARLEKNNYDVRAVDLAVAEPSAALSTCDAVFVVGPLTPFSKTEAQSFAEHVEKGGGLLLALGPLTDEAGDIIDSGLASVLSTWGIKTTNGVVFERDPALTLPVGYGGEVFLATPLPHAATRGLLVGDSVRARIVFQLSQSLSLSEHSEAVALAQTGPSALYVASFRGLGGGEFLDAPSDAGQVQPVAVALELAGKRRPDGQRAARVAVLGSPSPLWSSTWLEPQLWGTRRFVENLTSWLAAQPELVSVPEKASQPVGLYLTEEAMVEVQRYVLFYLPASVLLLGALVLWRRRVPLESRETPRGGEGKE